MFAIQDKSTKELDKERFNTLGENFEALKLLSLIQFIGSSHIRDANDRKKFNESILELGDLIFPDYFHPCQP